MKFGFRTPSFKRSLSAMTKGAAKRALMREIVPNYGKRGMGWANPKKAAYNRVYNMTTASPIDILTNKEEHKKSAQNVKKEPFKSRTTKRKDFWQRALPAIGFIAGIAIILWLLGVSFDVIFMICMGGLLSLGLLLKDILDGK